MRDDSEWIALTSTTASREERLAALSALQEANINADDRVRILEHAAIQTRDGAIARRIGDALVLPGGLSSLLGALHVVHAAVAPQMREAVIRSLMSLGDEGMLFAIAAGVSSPHAESQALSFSLLGGVNAAFVEGILKSKFLDYGDQRRAAAGVALCRVGNSLGISYVRSQIRSSEWVWDADGRVELAAILALMRQGDGLAMSRLQNIRVNISQAPQHEVSEFIHSLAPEVNAGGEDIYLDLMRWAVQLGKVTDTDSGEL